MKKILSLILTFIMLCMGATTAFAVDINSEYMEEQLNLSPSQTDTPKALQDRYPENNFSLVKLGDIKDYSLYYNVTEYYRFLEYKNVIGEYEFDCFAQQSPYDLGLYVVGRDNAYTLKEAYDKGIIDMDLAVELINAQTEIKYNFTVKKVENTTPKVLQDRYPENNFSLVKLGDIKDYSLYYNVTEYYRFLEYKNVIGEYEFDCFAQQSPYDLGLYVVGRDNAYTLKEAYDKGIIDMDLAVELINAQTDVKYNFTVAKITKLEIKAPVISAKKTELKAGKSKKLTVSNGVVKSWSSSNKKVASVSKGNITALHKGKATITATLNTGKKVTCKVTVTTAPQLNKKTISVKKGSTVTVKLSGKATKIDSKYTNTKYAKIISNKKASAIKVKGLKKGTTTLKIKVNGVKVLKLKVKVK